MSKKRKLNAHLWERHPDDWYVEPEGVSARLFDMEDFGDDPLILDPACGSGRIVRAAHEAGYAAVGADKVSRTIDCSHVCDFLTEKFAGFDWVVSNPPFSLCAMRYRNDPPPPFVVKALSVARVGVAMLLPLPWLAGATRSRWLASSGLARVLVCVPRPSMPPGPVIEAGEDPGGGEEDFAWFIFRKGHTDPWTGGWCDWKAQQ